MRKVERTLVDAYRRQEDIYNGILDMVKEQKQLLAGESSGKMAPVLDICARIEEELQKISSIESEIEEAKEQWLENNDTLPAELEDVLDRIKQTIEQTRSLQEQMSMTLAEERRLNPDSAADGSRGSGMPGARRAKNAYSNV